MAILQNAPHPAMPQREWGSVNTDSPWFASVSLRLASDMDCWASVAYEDVGGLLNGQPAMRIAGVGFVVVVSPRNAVSALGQRPGDI